MRTVKELIAELNRRAQKAGICDDFRDRVAQATELREIFAYMQTTPGIEFVIKKRVPTLTLFRELAQYDIEPYGIYVDMGEISLFEREKITLVGNTSAKIFCSLTKRFCVNLLYGARAEIYASGYSVIHVEKDKRGEVKFFAKDNAIILE